MFRGSTPSRGQDLPVASTVDCCPEMTKANSQYRVHPERQPASDTIQNPFGTMTKDHCPVVECLPVLREKRTSLKMTSLFKRPFFEISVDSGRNATTGLWSSWVPGALSYVETIPVQQKMKNGLAI